MIQFVMLTKLRTGLEWVALSKLCLFYQELTESNCSQYEFSLNGRMPGIMWGVHYQ